MAEFSSGVKDYIIGTAKVQVFFPVDFKDNADVSCRQCRFYRINSRRCGLNDEVIPYPEKYIGPNCPIEFERSSLV